LLDSGRVVYSVIETPDFVSDAKEAGLSREEVETVILHLGKKLRRVTGSKAPVVHGKSALLVEAREERWIPRHQLFRRR
jgi:hypothetical protein